MGALAQLVWSQVEGFGSTLLASVVIFLGLCALQIARAPRDKPRAEPPPEFVVDMIYWPAVAVYRVFSRLIVLALLVLGALAFGLTLSPRIYEGFGPVVEQPRWLMMIELVVLTDLLSYGSHRACHRVPFLWRFHAVHHSPRRVHWTSTARMHPINDLVTYAGLALPPLAIGFPLEAIAPLAPVIVLFAVWSHSKSTALLGGIGWILTGPRFHRWHHTHPDEGGNANFSGIFSLWDRLFGTYYMPAGRLPERFGLAEEVMDESFWAQMVQPFRKRGRKARVLTMPEQEGELTAATHSR